MQHNSLFYSLRNYLIKVKVGWIYKSDGFYGRINEKKYYLFITF